jgi:RHS repeat-associated protein
VHITPQFERLDVGGSVTRTAYYGFGGQRVAMRVYSTWPGDVYYLHGDHLGSASLTTDAAGNPQAEQRYYPFGESRWMSGTLPTDRRFTGQLELAGLGIYDYGARAYSPLLGRFLSADTIVPQPSDPQAFNRYSYVQNSPLRFVDPTGHHLCDSAAECDSEGYTRPERISPYIIDDICNGVYTCEQEYFGAFLKAYPNYNPLADPARFTPGGELKPFFARVIMVSAQYELDHGREGPAYQYMQARYSGEVGAALIGETPAFAILGIKAVGGIRGAAIGRGSQGGTTGGKGVTKAVRTEVLQKNKAANPDGHYSCEYCGYENTDSAHFDVDHIIPSSKGGNLDPNNVRALCVGCNRSAQENWPPKPGSDWATRRADQDMRRK